MRFAHLSMNASDKSSPSQGKELYIQNLVGVVLVVILILFIYPPGCTQRQGVVEK